jgi:hypothetical protein
MRLDYKETLILTTQTHSYLKIQRPNTSAIRDGLEYKHASQQNANPAKKTDLVFHPNGTIIAAVVEIAFANMYINITKKLLAFSQKRESFLRAGHKNTSSLVNIYALFVLE